MFRKDTRYIRSKGGSGNYSSGAVEFENDWPGLFIRGDNCICLSIVLETLRDACKNEELIECIGEYLVVKE